ncbi:hypothetical protein Back11_42110 [Paenibacillus baekrokdamisoli]|uniref:Uncharacterized protein n=1 Tax=Paenibacillus baekrokdamisoli TaxID=1712516 RepID=A0A3G9IWH3_9BACL|nr:hypothetical protein [Paenibacillus baekrokdamisoli]MBB3068090.1 hypothetical protein [Paenibacillus baekrokdamisoli]BBH22866.1 hypothetical protein Back11_42110 [Paenibacillus baekrokdamisoli]
MGIQRLVGLRLLSASKSYIDALHGILSHSGLYTAPKYMLAGMTVTGFRFTVDRLITAESPTAYNWMAENFLAADFIGITSAQHAGFSFEHTFPLYQKGAIHDIKRSIDRGIGAIAWKDQFVIVTGYDDSRQVLFYSDGRDSGDGFNRPQAHEAELPYEQFGRNLSPYWYYQIVEERVELDEREIYRESFMQAIYKWETHDLMLPEGEYACGKRAYSAIIHALETGCYDKTGIWSVIDTYAAAKRDLACYTQKLEQLWPQSRSVAACYAELNQIYEQIVDTAAAGCNEGTTEEPKLVNQLIALFHKALAIEDEAIQNMKRLMRETVDNRFNDIALR